MLWHPPQVFRILRRGQGSPLRRHAGRATRAATLAALIVLASVGVAGSVAQVGAGPIGSGAVVSPVIAAGPVSARTLPPGSTYHALSPVRVLDSATGTGGAAPLASDSPESFQVAGAFGIPRGATAVAGTLSISGATEAGSVSLTPVSTSRAAACTSTVGVQPGSPRSTGVTAVLGDDGRLWALYLASGGGQTAQLAFDLDGYYSPDETGATYHPVEPARVFDSRTAAGGAVALVSDEPETFQLAGSFGIPVDATAVTGTLAVDSPSSPGTVELAEEQTAGAIPAASTFSLAAPGTTATGVTVTLDPSGRFTADYETGNSGDTAQVAFDLTGYFTPDMTGSTFHRLGPLRLIDSGSGVGGARRIASEIPESIKIAGLYGIPDGATAVAGTLSVEDPTAAGSLSLTPSPSAVPTGAATAAPSSLYFGAAEDADATVIAPLGAGGNFWATLETGSSGQDAGIAFDLSGYFAADAAGLTPVPAYFEKQSSFASAVTDANGVVMASYPSPLGLQYNPVRIAQCAIWHFYRWHSGTDTPVQVEADRTAFWIQVDWLVSNQMPDGRWLYTFQWGKMTRPWWSAMAEGLGMSVMLRAYSVSGDAAYLRVLDLARSTFDRSIAANGVASSVTVSGRQMTVYQEYLPGYDDNVLNGWIFSIAGLYECAIYLGDPICLHDVTAADRGLAAVRALLPYYDIGTWSLYSLNTLTGPNRGPTASDGYQTLHIKQLRFLYSITGDPLMKEYAEKFQVDLNNAVEHGSASPSVSPAASSAGG
jgi:D-glucuronyl C5-epimerase C-terminus